MDRIRLDGFLFLVFLVWLEVYVFRKVFGEIFSYVEGFCIYLLFVFVEVILDVNNSCYL